MEHIGEQTFVSTGSASMLSLPYTPHVGNICKSVTQQQSPNHGTTVFEKCLPRYV